MNWSPSRHHVTDICRYPQVPGGHRHPPQEPSDRGERRSSSSQVHREPRSRQNLPGEDFCCFFLAFFFMFFLRLWWRQCLAPWPHGLPQAMWPRGLCLCRICDRGQRPTLARSSSSGSLIQSLARTRTGWVYKVTPLVTFYPGHLKFKGLSNVLYLHNLPRIS